MSAVMEADESEGASKKALHTAERGSRKEAASKRRLSKTGSKMKPSFFLYTYSCNSDLDLHCLAPILQAPPFCFGSIHRNTEHFQRNTIVFRGF